MALRGSMEMTIAAAITHDKNRFANFFFILQVSLPFL